MCGSEVFPHLLMSLFTFITFRAEVTPRVLCHDALIQQHCSLFWSSGRGPVYVHTECEPEFGSGEMAGEHLEMCVNVRVCQVLTPKAGHL